MTTATARYIVTRADGRPIPDDEPCFVVRGQDRFAIQAIEAYIALTGGAVAPSVTEELWAHRDRIRRWQQANPTRLKIPD